MFVCSACGFTQPTGPEGTERMFEHIRTVHRRADPS